MGPCKTPNLHGGGCVLETCQNNMRRSERRPRRLGEGLKKKKKSLRLTAPLDPRRLLRHRHQSLCPGFRHMVFTMHQVPGPHTQNELGRAHPTLIILLGGHRTTVCTIRPPFEGCAISLRGEKGKSERSSCLSLWDFTGPSVFHYMNL